MTTKVIIKGPSPNAGRILVQEVNPTKPTEQAAKSPIEIPEGEEREFWIHQTNAILITELPSANGKGSAPAKKR